MDSYNLVHKVGGFAVNEGDDGVEQVGARGMTGWGMFLSGSSCKGGILYGNV